MASEADKSYRDHLDDIYSYHAFLSPRSFSLQVIQLRAKLTIHLQKLKEYLRIV